jgi:TRAP-type C4-dicarboxylate transport system permease small subunit
MNDVSNRLNEIKIENYIWIIYLGIIFLSYYSNSLEKDYLLNNNYISRETYRYIMIIIFTILVLVYLYFLVDSYNGIKNIDINNMDETDRLSLLSFIGSLLVFISGIIFLYIAINDKDINVELAFNYF